MLTPILALTASFFFVAMVYASIGFGGGSTYTALLVLDGVDVRVVPVISLCCNIIVVSGGCYNYYRAGHLFFRKVFPFVLASVPAAFVGGLLAVPESLFIKILSVALFVSGAQMLLTNPKMLTPKRLRWPRSVACAVGAFLGFLAGITGIGGGIFLAPVLYWLRWDSQKTIAALCSFFILVNSASGLLGHLVKDSANVTGNLAAYSPLFLAVALGGFVGAWVGCYKVSRTSVQRLTALLIIYVSVRLIYQGWF